MPLTQVRFPRAARNFLPKVNFQCWLSFSVRTPPCAFTCINICVHDKDPVLHVWVRWIIATYPARTEKKKARLATVSSARRQGCARCRINTEWTVSRVRLASSSATWYWEGGVGEVQHYHKCDLRVTTAAARLDFDRTKTFICTCIKQQKWMYLRR